MLQVESAPEKELGTGIAMAPGLDLSVLAREVEHHNDTTVPQASAKINTVTTTTAGETVLDPSSVTQDFDDLRFSAAAALQLPTATTNSPALSSLLISSPYNNPGHYLDLSTLDVPSLIFAKALTALKPLRSDYATADYMSALDFSAVLFLVRRFSRELAHTWTSHTFYVVIFRSQLKPDANSDLLYQLDYESHREACESGGLLKYWFGKTDGERRNLATCKCLSFLTWM